MTDFITPVPDSDPQQWTIDPTDLAANIYTVTTEGAAQIAYLFRQFGYPDFADTIDYAIAPRRTTMSAMSDDGTSDGVPYPATALCDVHVVVDLDVSADRWQAVADAIDFLALVDFTTTYTLACRVCGGIVLPP